VKTAGE